MVIPAAENQGSGRGLGSPAVTLKCVSGYEQRGWRAYLLAALLLAMYGLIGVMVLRDGRPIGDFMVLMGGGLLVMAVYALTVPLVSGMRLQVSSQGIAYRNGLPTWFGAAWSGWTLPWAEIRAITCAASEGHPDNPFRFRYCLLTHDGERYVYPLQWISDADLGLLRRLRWQRAKRWLLSRLRRDRGRALFAVEEMRHILAATPFTQCLTQRGLAPLYEGPRRGRVAAGRPGQEIPPGPRRRGA